MDVLTTSARIKARCKAQKISVKNLLEQTQINRNFIYDLEKGGQIPSAEKLERIADSVSYTHLDVYKRQEVQQTKFIYDYVGLHRPKDFTKKIFTILRSYFPDITKGEVKEATDAAYAEYALSLIHI